MCIPMPWPLRESLSVALVVKKGVNIFFRSPCFIPMPLSKISNEIRSASVPALISTFPRNTSSLENSPCLIKLSFSSIASKALSNIFSKTCSICKLLHQAFGRVSGISATLPKAWCNSLQIEQVLENMLDNALEAIEEKESLIKHGEFSNDEVFRGKVLIKAGTDAERISLEILDNGIGIKQGDLKNMFTPFFTTKATERLSRKGHGIGMHMVKEILRAHQGKIYVAGTEFGKGTTFRIEFPLEIAESKKL